MSRRSVAATIAACIHYVRFLGVNKFGAPPGSRCYVPDNPILQFSQTQSAYDSRAPSVAVNRCIDHLE